MRVRFGDFVFDSERHELLRGGAPLALSPKAFALLEALLESAPSPASKEALYERLWPSTFVEAGNLHNLVSEIRATLGDHALIRTVHRFGYAFGGRAIPDDPLRFSILLGDEEIALRPGINVIGRDPAAAVVIHAPDVSRHHAQLIVEGSQLTLEDLGSKNGTFVGTTRVTAPVVLQHGDEILIGKTRLRVRVASAPAETVTAAR